MKADWPLVPIAVKPFLKHASTKTLTAKKKQQQCLAAAESETVIYAKHENTNKDTDP